MTPFQRATIVTLKTITLLSSLREVIIESDAPGDLVEKEQRRLGQGSCGCIVYWGRWPNKGPRLSKDERWKTWWRETNEGFKSLRQSNARSSVLFCQMSICQWSFLSLCMSQPVANGHFPVRPWKLYCRLVKILEVGGLSVTKKIASRMKPIKDVFCSTRKRNIHSEIYDNGIS